MKTAISVPDALFRKADAAARRLKVSRSQLFATAVAEFLERESSEAITERLNKVYAEQSSRLDPALYRAHLKSIDKESW